MRSVYTKLICLCGMVGIAVPVAPALSQSWQPKQSLQPKDPNAPDLVAARALNAGKLMDPPQLMLVTKIVAKPGMMPQVQKLEAERASALRRAGHNRDFIGSASITGISQLWVMTRLDKITDLADDPNALAHNPGLKAELARIDAAELPLIESKRDVSLKYNPDISYRPAFNWSAVRYWEIIWVHLRDGHHEPYFRNRKLTREQHERGAFDTHQMMYSVQTGEQSGTFFVMRPMRTLGLLDELHAVDDGEPETAEEKAQKIADYADSAISEEEAYFQVLPDVTSVK